MKTIFEKNEDGMEKMTNNEVLEKVFKLDPRINVVIQIQSYGRVFIYDQLGVVLDKDEAICVFPKEDTIEDRINKGLNSFYKKCQEQVCVCG